MIVAILFGALILLLYYALVSWKMYDWFAYYKEVCKFHNWSNRKMIITSLLISVLIVLTAPFIILAMLTESFDADMYYKEIAEICCRKIW